MKKFGPRVYLQQNRWVRDPSIIVPVVNIPLDLTQKGYSNEDINLILRSLKLLTPGHQFGGHVK